MDLKTIIEGENVGHFKTSCVFVRNGSRIMKFTYFSSGGLLKMTIFRVVRYIPWNRTLQHTINPRTCPQ